VGREGTAGTVVVDEVRVVILVPVEEETGEAEEERKD
jgi:hypothetical protein